MRDSLPFTTTDRFEHEDASAPKPAASLGSDRVDQASSSPERAESTARDRITTIARSLDREATYDDILRELAFERMVYRGLDDLAAGRMFTTDQLSQKIHSWRH